MTVSGLLYLMITIVFSNNYFVQIVQNPRLLLNSDWTSKRNEFAHKTQRTPSFLVGDHCESCIRSTKESQNFVHY